MHWATSAAVGTLVGIGLGIWFGIALVRHAIVRFLAWSPEDVTYDCANRTLELQVTGTDPLPKRVYAVVLSYSPTLPLPDRPPLEALCELTTETIGQKISITDDRDEPLWPVEGSWYAVIWGGTAYTVNGTFLGACTYGVGREPVSTSGEVWGEV